MHLYELLNKIDEDRKVRLDELLDRVDEETWVRNKKTGNIYPVKHFNPETQEKPKAEEIRQAQKSEIEQQQADQAKDKQGEPTTKKSFKESLKEKLTGIKKAISSKIDVAKKVATELKTPLLQLTPSMVTASLWAGTVAAGVSGHATASKMLLMSSSFSTMFTMATESGMMETLKRIEKSKVFSRIRSHLRGKVPTVQVDYRNPDLDSKYLLRDQKLVQLAGGERNVLKIQERWKRAVWASKDPSRSKKSSDPQYWFLRYQSLYSIQGNKEKDADGEQTYPYISSDAIWHFLQTRPQEQEQIKESMLSESSTESRETLMAEYESDELFGIIQFYLDKIELKSITETELEDFSELTDELDQALATSLSADEKSEYEELKKTIGSLKAEDLLDQKQDKESKSFVDF